MHQITVNDLVVDVVRKDIKNLHLAVYPPNGRVRVAAPLRVDDDAAAICDTLKNINNLRQGYPTHGDNLDKVLPAHRFFRLRYPVTDYEAAWESVLGKYFEAMRAMRDGMSAAWARSPRP